MRAFEHRHVVSFEETCLVGNIYYVNHLRWQGRCRELFLRDHAPDVLAQLTQGLCLVTLRCSCEYLAELAAFDEVVIRMRLGALTQNRMTLTFEYWRQAGPDEELIARGEQQVACMRREGAHLVPTPIPASLSAALRSFSGRPDLPRPSDPLASGSWTSDPAPQIWHNRPIPSDMSPRPADNLPE